MYVSVKHEGSMTTYEAGKMKVVGQHSNGDVAFKVKFDDAEVTDMRDRTMIFLAVMEPTNDFSVIRP